jgi:hypothetical protein
MAPPIPPYRLPPGATPGVTPPDYSGSGGVLQQFQEQTRTITAEQQSGLSLGAALLSLSFEESRPTLGGGLSLYARQQRELDRLKGRVGKLEQEA